LRSKASKFGSRSGRTAKATGFSHRSSRIPRWIRPASHGEGSDESIAVAVESIEGSAGRDDPTVLTAKGIALEKPFDLSLTGGSLAGLSESGQPWPIDVQAKLADAVASLQGGIADPLGAPNVDVRIEGAIGKTTFRGDVAIELLSKPPRISGSVDIAALDLEPYLTHESPAPETPTEFSLDDMSLSLQGLHDLDADVTFTADRVLGLPMDIRDATVSPVIDGGRLTAPIEATVSAVPVEGMLAVESTPDALGFEIALASEGSDIENLRAVTRHAKGVKGGTRKASRAASNDSRCVGRDAGTIFAQPSKIWTSTYCSIARISPTATRTGRSRSP
jgi:hypothetical protein